MDSPVRRLAIGGLAVAGGVGRRYLTSAVVQDLCGGRHRLTERLLGAELRDEHKTRPLVRWARCCNQKTYTLRSMAMLAVSI